jgi:hypothetical protein
MVGKGAIPYACFAAKLPIVIAAEHSTKAPILAQDELPQLLVRF